MRDSNRKLRVLIAGDEAEMRRAIAEVLRGEFTVVAAIADGRQLVETAIEKKPDVIVSEIVMPHCTGPQARDSLKARGHDVPFVLIVLDAVAGGEFVRNGTAIVDVFDVVHELVPAIRAAVAGQTYVSRHAR